MNFQAKLTAAAVAIFLAAPAAGAETQNPKMKFTGPVTVVDRQDILLSGMQTVYDLLISRSSVNSFGITRSWQAGRTAVFLNGRPAHIELSYIPLTAVERIEIFGGSVAGISGQAGAGAINIVTRQQADGFETQSGILLPTAPGGDERTIGVSWSGEFGGGRLTVGLHSFGSEEIADSQRPHSRAKWQTGGNFADTAGVNAGGNTVYVFGNTTRAASFGSCSAQDGYTGKLKNPPGVSATFNDSGCGFAYGDFQWSTNKTKNTSLRLSFDLPTDAGPEIYADLFWTRLGYSSRLAPPVGTFTITPTDSQKMSIYAELYGWDPSTWPNTMPDPVFAVSHRFIGHGNREWDTSGNDLSLSLGVQGDAGPGLGYSVGMLVSRFDSKTRGGPFVGREEIVKLNNDGKYNLEDPASDDADHLAAIRSSSMWSTRNVLYDFRSLNAVIDGELGDLGGGAAAWTAGVEYSALKSSSLRGFTDADGAVTTSTPLGTGGGTHSGSRKTQSIFAETLIPATESLEFVAAARQDNHSDVGKARSYRAESRFAFNDSLTFRGSWGDSSRPPSISSLTSDTSESYPYVCDTKNYSGSGACARQQVRRVSGGNPELSPVREKTLSFGADFDIGPVSASLDWFRIRESELPAQPSAQQILDLEAKGSLPAGVTVDRSGALVIHGSVASIGESEFKGIRAEAGSDWSTSFGDFGWQTRIIRHNDYDFKVAGVVQPGHTARTRVHNTFRLTRGEVTLNWDTHYRAAFANSDGTGRFPAWISHDLTVAWENPFGVEGPTLLAGVLNAADAAPSVDSSNPNSWASQLDATRGRAVFIGVSQSF